MIHIEENALKLDIYLYLRQEVGWKRLSNTQATKAIDNCLYNVVVFDDDKPVGMGRVVGDGAVISYIQDLVVLPEYQGKKIGSMVIGKLIDYVESITEEGTEMMLCLMCAKGREGFYLKHGFMSRPTQNLGPGMIQYIRKMF